MTRERIRRVRDDFLNSTTTTGSPCIEVAENALTACARVEADTSDLCHYLYLLLAKIQSRSYALSYTGTCCKGMWYQMYKGGDPGGAYSHT